MAGCSGGCSLPDAAHFLDDALDAQAVHAGVARLCVNLSGRIDARAARHPGHGGILAEARLTEKPEAQVDVVPVAGSARLSRTPQDDSRNAARVSSGVACPDVVREVVGEGID